MMMKEADKKEKIEEVLARGVSKVYPSKETLRERLLSGSRLRVYLGVDPTGPHLHLGHLTNLLILKRLQELGHEIIFLIGDFTARIGDPTDKTAPRQALTKNEVKENMKTFKDQASRVISFSGNNPVKIRFNSEWYEKKDKKEGKKRRKEISFEFFMKNLLGSFNVQNLLARDDFKKRMEENRPIKLQEFIYPLLQGFDGVEMNVDMEIGGNDQTFNMNIGRLLRKSFIGKGYIGYTGKTTSRGEKFFIATTLLVNPNTGKKLMNKSEGGLINLDDSPDEIFGKAMALDDASMFPVAELSTEMPIERIGTLRQEVKSKKINPRNAKLEIAGWVVRTIYGEVAAKKAGEEWNRLFSKKELTGDISVLKVVNGKSLIDLVILSGVAKSKGEARRLIKQGAVEIDSVAKKATNEKLTFRGGEVLKIGKKKFFRVKI